MTIYYSQEDKRWSAVPYTRTGNSKQTLGSSACGPTSFAMVVSTYKDKVILPPETAAFAVERGYRTVDSGTAWSYFDAIARHYGLTCKQSGSLVEVKQALTAGALVIATMGPGHMTGGGHYVLLVGIAGEWISVHDPNHDNTKYGNDGLIRQGVKDDGKIDAHESVFAKEARQYWIFPQPIKNEEDDILQLTNYQWTTLAAGVDSLLKRKVITDTTWLDKISKRTLTVSELAWLTFIITNK